MEKQMICTPKCPIRTTMELIGGKWKLLILFQLREGAMRLSRLKSAIPGISEKMLVQELKIMEDNLLVYRRDFKENPPRVEYSLTAKGKHVLPLIEAMEQFAENYQATINDVT